MSTARFWGRLAVLLIVVVAAVVVIEGFALSWGGRIETSQATLPSTTLTTVVSPDPALSGCLPGENGRLMQVVYVRFAKGSSSALITGNDVTFISGGPDDGRFKVLATQRTAVLSPNVRITLLDVQNVIFYYRGSIVQLNDYLARDLAPSIFCLQGPISGVTALTAEYHP